jgi:hypothetical protein
LGLEKNSQEWRRRLDKVHNRRLTALIRSAFRSNPPVTEWRVAMMKSATGHIIRGLFKGTQEAFNASVSFRLPRRPETTRCL